MATIGESSTSDLAQRTVPVPGSSLRAVSVVTVAIAAHPLGFAFTHGADGSPGWQVGRAALALTIGVAALCIELRGSRTVRAWSALALGIAGLTVGAGIGVMHIAKSDLTLAAVAAVVVLTSGIVLTATAAHRLWTLSHLWWRLLGVPLVPELRGDTYLYNHARKRRTLDAARYAAHRRPLAPPSPVGATRHRLPRPDPIDKGPIGGRDDATDMAGL